ncbi:MAG: hypothetical protein A2W05_08595 [Candidatus Schekmanbacteria bacterium RBG_16_38_10]|uniref:J domain-containing protein n=1 Tax=Candidatus Schekmanbacteria bacterium RBG_16_38_10 TaxID=1817879 RepID=A0A1F7RVG7_9BACT|nr:MAG: hypothetical protein A2W05_08595 [Candidatus Schekmanbacteria bacterium RBG_16_38_10]
MGEIGKYIYGIINSNTAISFFIPGDPFKEEKGKGYRVYTIPYENISTIVCDSEIVDYTRMSKDAVARLLVGHQQIIEKIMNVGYSVIPVRLGTFAVDETEVKDILNKGYSLIKDIVEKISDKIEIDVVATWNDFIPVLKEVGEEKEIKEFKERLLANPKEMTIDEQIKIGAMVKEALDRKREKCAEEIQKALRIFSHDFKVHEIMDDKMVINTAFLIGKEKQRDFEKEVEELNAKFTEKLNFRCVGQLPPYSFYTLEIKKMQFEEIQWARKKLDLNDFTTKDEIKKAYHRLALTSHPDKNPNKSGIEREFGEVTNAYMILLDYCRAFEQTSQVETCSFDEGELKKNAILVKVKK